MSISEMLLPEIDQEATSTRKVLERCPTEKFGWQPHQKSWTMGKLAGHLVAMAKWGTMTLDSDGFNFEPGEYQEEVRATTEQLLADFDVNLKGFRDKLALMTDEEMHKTWTLKISGQLIFAMPRTEVLRTSVMNHTVHHRAQLGVYLRLLDIPVPAIYGPTADETGG